MKSVIAIVFSLMVTPFVFADGDAEYKYREGVMKTIGGHMSSLAAILRGNVHFDDLSLHAKGLAELATIAPYVFPEGSGVSRSEALPAIWEKPAEFKTAMDRFVKAADGMAAAAGTGDMGAVGPAMKELGQSCKGCHDDFREEED